MWYFNVRERRLPNATKQTYGCCSIAFMPVSYTHLDVYKRQSYERAEWNEKVISMPEVPSDHSCAKGAWKNRDFVSEMPV